MSTTQPFWHITCCQPQEANRVISKPCYTRERSPTAVGCNCWQSFHINMSICGHRRSLRQGNNSETAVNNTAIWAHNSASYHYQPHESIGVITKPCHTPERSPTAVRGDAEFHRGDKTPNEDRDWIKVNVGKVLYDSLKVLELGLGASEAEVKMRYREFSRTYHPDKHRSKVTGKTNKEDFFKLINNTQAYLQEIL